MIGVWDKDGIMMNNKRKHFSKFDLDFFPMNMKLSMKLKDIILNEKKKGTK